MITKQNIVVLKFGTTSVCDTDTLAIREDWIQSVAKDVKNLIENGNGVIIFTSGGLATGKRKNSTVDLEQSTWYKNILGAIGLNDLLYKWQQNFELMNIPTATLLLRVEDIESTSVSTVLLEMLEKGILPIINENIPLQHNFNNDELAAAICQKINASKFVLFTDTDGVFTDNPKTNPNAVHLQELDIDHIEVKLGNKVSSLGSGGMEAKLTSAIKIKKLGIPTIITNGVDLFPIRNLGIVGKHTVLKANGN